MKVTVFMPTYNTEKYIKEAIESILTQSFKDFELLIINDGSTDGTMEIVKSFEDERIRIIENKENKGLPYVREQGMKLAKGEYIAIMDSDDIAIEKRLEKQVKFLDENSDIALLGGAFLVIDTENEIKEKVHSYQNPNFINAMLLFYDCIANSTIMFRKNFIIENNIKHDLSCFVGEDYKFLIDVSLKGKVTCLQDNLLKYRVGHNSTTRLSNELKKEKRDKVLSEIRSYFMTSHNLSLDSREKEIFEKIFSEGGRFDSVEEVKEVYKLLNNLKLQYAQKVPEGKQAFADAIRLNFCEKLKTLRTPWGFDNRLELF